MESMLATPPLRRLPGRGGRGRNGGSGVFLAPRLWRFRSCSSSKVVVFSCCGAAVAYPHGRDSPVAVHLVVDFPVMQLQFVPHPCGRGRRRVWRWLLLGWFCQFSSRCVPLRCRQGQDAPHHVRYGPEGQLCSGLALLVLHLALCSFLSSSGHRCLSSWPTCTRRSGTWRRAENCGFSAVAVHRRSSFSLSWCRGGFPWS